MKIRSDFVTNSSSANYTLVLRIIDEDGEEAGAGFSVSPECAITMDGGKNGCDITFDGSFSELRAMIKEGKSIDDIIYAMCSGISIDKWDDEEEDEEEDEDDDFFAKADDDEEAKADIAFIKGKVTGDGAGYPRTIIMFKDMANALGITSDKIRYLVTENCKYGSGDSAMWIEMDIFDPYRERYAAAQTDDEKEAIIEEAASYIMSEPEWEINDNEYCIEEPLPIVWGGSYLELCEAVKAALDKKPNHRNGSYWMGSSADITKYDVKTGKTETRSVFYVEG